MQSAPLAIDRIINVSVCLSNDVLLTNAYSNRRTRDAALSDVKGHIPLLNPLWHGHFDAVDTDPARIENRGEDRAGRSVYDYRGLRESHRRRIRRRGRAGRHRRRSRPETAGIDIQVIALVDRIDEVDRQTVIDANDIGDQVRRA